MSVSERHGSWDAPTRLQLPPDADRGDLQVTWVNGTTCVSAGNCTAVGYYTTGSSPNTEDSPLIVNEHNGVWSRAQRLPLQPGAGAILNSIACASTDNCVAVGNYIDPHELPLIASETNGKWGQAITLRLPSEAPTGDDAAAELESVACTSADNCIAVGGYYDKSSAVQSMIANETDGVWRPAQKLGNVTGKGDAILVSVACPRAGSCEAVGNPTETGAAGNIATETHGTWTIRNGPRLAGGPQLRDESVYLTSLACPSPGSCVAVGASQDLDGLFHPLVLVQKSGTWSHPQFVRVPPNGLSSQPIGQLMSVSCPGDTQCVAVGRYVAQDNAYHLMRVRLAP